MPYLAMMDITKKWIGRRQDCSMIHAQMALFFADRMPKQHRRNRASGARRATSPPLIRPRRRYGEKGGTEQAAAALKYFALFCSAFGVYTDFGTDPRKSRLIPPGGLLSDRPLFYGRFKLTFLLTYFQSTLRFDVCVFSLRISSLLIRTVVPG